MKNDTNNTRQVGSISDRVIQLTGIDTKPNTPILIGDPNQLHMKEEHPDDYQKYVKYLTDILTEPTYIAKHPNKDSIEYIRVYSNPDNDNDHVLVAVRVTGNGKFFARALFVMSHEKVKKYKKKGYFMPY